MDNDEELLAAFAASKAEYDAEQAEVDAALFASLEEEQRPGPPTTDVDLIAALAASQAEYNTCPYRITIQLEARFIGQIVGPRFVNSNAIARRVGHGCKISAFRNPAEQSGIRIAAQTQDAVDEAENEILGKFYELAATHVPPGFQRTDEQILEGLRGPLRPEEFRHVFMDNSNIWISALSSFDGTGRHNQAVRLNVRGLTTLLERGRDSHCEVGQRFVSGSKPPSFNAIWQRYRDFGYHTEVTIFPFPPNKYVF